MEGYAAFPVRARRKFWGNVPRMGGGRSFRPDRIAGRLTANARSLDDSRPEFRAPRGGRFRRAALPRIEASRTGRDVG